MGLGVGGGSSDSSMSFVYSVTSSADWSAAWYVEVDSLIWDPPFLRFSIADLSAPAIFPVLTARAIN